MIARSPTVHVAAAFAIACSADPEGPARAVVILEHGRATGLAGRLRQDLLVHAAMTASDPSVVELGRTLASTRRRAAEAAARFERLPDGPVRQVASGELTDIARQTSALAADLADRLSMTDAGAALRAETSLTAIRSVSSASVPLVYSLLTRWGALLVLVTPDPTPEMMACPLTSIELAAVTRGVGSDGPPDDTVLRMVGDRLATPLAAWLRQHGAVGARLLPFGILAGIPWHACPLGGLADLHSAATLGDEFDIAYLPSATAALLSTTKSAVPYRYTLMGGVDGPALSGAEDDICMRNYPHPGHRPTAFPPVVEEVPQVLHISCHAELRQDSPLASVFHLAGGDWKLGELRESGLLAGTSLVVAAACETARTVRRVQDEMIGLGTGLIECGARLVVASLWPVDDRATFLLITELYRQLDRLDPRWADPARHAPPALRAATQWLRRSTLGEIRVRARTSPDWTGTNALSTFAEWPGPDDLRAFQHPYYWAGFIALDASTRSGE